MSFKVLHSPHGRSPSEIGPYCILFKLKRRILKKENIDINAMLSLLKIMREIEPKRISNSKLSDHPNTIERIEYTEDAIEKYDNNSVTNYELEALFEEIKNKNRK